MPSLIGGQGQVPCSRRLSTCQPGCHGAAQEAPPAGMHTHTHKHTDNTVFSTPLQHCFPCLPPLPNHRDLKAALQAGGPLAALCCLSWALCWSSSGPAGPEIRRGARTGALPYTPPTSQDIQVTSFVRHLTQKGNSSPIGQKTLPSSIPPVNAGVPGQSALGVWPCWAAQPLQPHSSCSFTYS